MSAGFPYDLHPVFRRMTVADLDAVLALEEVSFSAPWSANTYRREITRNEHGSYWVVSPRDEADSAVLPILAYGGMWQLGDEIHITTIAVHPRWRRRGLGEWTLLKLIAEARQSGARLVTLEVRTTNQPAIALYHKLGFENVGTRRGYYADTGEDARLMTLFAIDDASVWQALEGALDDIERLSC